MSADTVVRTSPAARAPARIAVRPPARQAPKQDPVAARATDEPKRSALRLGVSYALPPPFVPPFADGRDLRAAGTALVVLLTASGAFLGIVYRFRRELGGVA